VRVFLALLPPLILFHPRVFFRTFFGPLADGVGYAISAAYAIVALVTVARAKGRARNIAIALVLFASATAIRYQIANIKWSIIGPIVMPYLACAVATVMAGNRAFVRGCLVALAAAISVDALTFLFPQFVAASLDSETAYGVSRYGSADLFAGRATGFHQSPGELVIFAAVTLGIGLGLLWTRHLILSLTLVGASSICLMATVNRSAVLAVAAIGVYLTIVALRGSPNAPRNLRRLAPRLVPPLAMVVVVATAFAYEPYREAIGERFDERQLATDTQTRMQGKAGVFDAIPTNLQSAVFGMVALGPEDSLAVFDGFDYINPHNGIVWLISSRGVICAGVFLYWLLSAVRALWRPPTVREMLEGNVPRTALLAGITGGLAISLVETALESSAVLTLLGLGLGMGVASPQPADVARPAANATTVRVAAVRTD
jgi:hypothetical protein